MITTSVVLENTKELNVLYVEDDIELLHSTKELFDIYFKSVEIASNGKDGLAKYIAYEQENGKYFDLVISDINMPELNGIEMATNILRENEMQAIVFITAYNTVEYFLEIVALGIDGFVSKPLCTEQLNKTFYKVSQAINDHKMINIYIDQIENLNAELVNQNNDLVQKNSELEKSLRMLDTVISKEERSYKKPKDAIVECIGEDELEEEIRNQMLQLVNDDLFELKEILIEIDVCIIGIINNLNDIPQDLLQALIKNFSKYAAILHYYTFFAELSVAMTHFANTMKETPLPETQENINNVFMFLETFVYVLSKWQNDLSSGDENKLNQLDASIISDMNTITNMWTQKASDEVYEEDLDDIFDF